jgi:GWxTD domain-containing protein
MRKLAHLLLSFILSAALNVCSSQLCAQQPPVRSAFELLRDSLAAISDTAGLRSQFRRARDERGGTSNLPSELRAGLMALRLGELGVDPDFSDARSSFRKASRSLPTRPEPWVGLGLAESGRSQREMSDPLRLGNRVGLGALERSADAYARALRIDPTFLPAALALSQVTLALLDSARLRDARTVLRQVAAALPVKSSDLWLALGRVERSSGALDSAGVDFERYLLTGGPRGRALLELARTLLALGRPDGDTAYYEGASIDDPEVVAEYRDDLEILAGAADLRGFDLLKGEARAAFLHHFWTERDHWELRAEGERLREHFRRLLFARAHFPLTISRRFYNSTDAYRSGNKEIDDRGIIYVRHGIPADRIRPFVFGVMPNESWRYIRSEGDLLFHFSAGYDSHGGGDIYDYRLVQSVMDLHGAADAPRDQLLLSRQSLSPVYSRMLNWGPFGAANEGARERNIGKTSIEVGTTTDSYELAFARRLSAVADLVAVGQAEGGSLAHLVFGIAARGISAERVGAGVGYRVRVRLTALARDTTVATLDTTFTITRPRALTDREYLVGRAQVILPAGTWRYRAALQEGDSAGVVLPMGSVRVARTEGESLSLSDIALGTPGHSVRWVTEIGDSVLLAPSKLFRKGAEMEIYYEASGATPSRRYRHEISVLPWDRRASKRQPLVSLAFEEEAPSNVIRSRRRAKLEKLKPGDYVVEVKLTAPDGTVELRQRAIRLIDP